MQLRRERIAERMRALQELVPNTNKVIMLSILVHVIIWVKTYVVHMPAIDTPQNFSKWSGVMMC